MKFKEPVANAVVVYAEKGAAAATAAGAGNRRKAERMSRRRVQLIKRELYANLVRISSTRALYYVSTRLPPTLALHTFEKSRATREYRLVYIKHRASMYPVFPVKRDSRSNVKLLNRYSETGEIVYTLINKCYL